MKEIELRQYATCSLCREKIGQCGMPLFYKLTVERFHVKSDAMKRQDGLAAFLGSARLAQVMGPDEEMAVPVMEPLVLTVCEACSTSRPHLVAVLAERDSVST